LSGGEHTDLLVLVVFWENSLDGILEHEVASSGWDVSDAVSNVSSPEGSWADLRDMSREAVSHSGVSLHFSGKNLWVGILGLDGKLDFLEWGGHGLGDGSRDTSSGEIDEWTWLSFFWHVGVF